MQINIIIPFILVSTILTTIVIGIPAKAVIATKKSSAIAVPKSKGSKKAWKSFGFGNIVGKMMREAKVAFCSELEALVLQMTRPDDSATATTNYATLSTCINQDFEDAEFVTSVITKLSRKFKEENIFTKFKSLLCLHAVLQKLNDDAQSSVCHCVDTLKTEEDVKYNQNYFLNEISSKLAGNVAELETVAVLKEYYPYLFYFIELKQSNDNIPDNLSGSSTSDKSSKSKAAITITENKITSLCELLNLGDKVTEACEGATSCNNSPLFKQFLDIMKTDREAAVKQLQKICDTKANQALTLSEGIIQTLTAHDIDVDVSAWTIVSGSSSLSEIKGDKSTVGAANKGGKSSDNKSGTKSGSSSTSKNKSSSAALPSKSTNSNSMESIEKSLAKQSHSKVSVVDDDDEGDEDEDEDDRASASMAKSNIKVAIASNNDKAVKQPSTSSTTTHHHHYSTVSSSSSSSSRPIATTTSTSGTSATTNKTPLTSSAAASQKVPSSTTTSGTSNNSKPSPTSSSSTNNKNGNTSNIPKTSSASKSNNSIKSPQSKTKSTKSKASVSSSSGSTTTKKKTRKSKK